MNFLALLGERARDRVDEVKGTKEVVDKDLFSLSSFSLLLSRACVTAAKRLRINYSSNPLAYSRDIKQRRAFVRVKIQHPGYRG